MSMIYYLRKKTGQAKINIRYRPNQETNIVLATPFSIDAEYWDLKKMQYNESLKKKNPRNEQDKNQNQFIDRFNIKLGEFKTSIDKFILENNYKVNSSQLKSFITEKFGGQPTPKNIKKNVTPNTISQLIEDYIEEKSVYSLGKHKPLTKASISKFNVIKNKLTKIDPKLTVNQVDNKFRDKFTKWCSQNNYSETTIVKELKIIKSFIRFAKSKRQKINQETLDWNFYIKPHSFNHPTLTLSELKIIESLSLQNDYLDNARDWLLIGCYTGQRVSDLLNFSSDGIFNKNLLRFTQQKTKNEIAIILIPQVIKILEKRNGEFPRKISDQKFNKFIKIICKEAGLKEILKGGKMIENRKKINTYEKWELVTSHICRRSFVTNFRHILGNEGIMVNTGHKTQEMVDLYDQNSAMDKVLKISQIISEKMDELITK